MNSFFAILLLIASNVFMTIAWYGHLRLAKSEFGANLGLFAFILISWGIAFFEYCLQVPANRIGYVGNGGAFDIWQLKVIQEVVALSVFTIFAVLVFKNEPLRINHLIGFAFLVLGTYFIFKK